MMFAAIEPAPPADEFQFPKTLAEKYQPKKLEDFVGVHEPRKVMQAFVKAPFKSAWFFLGESGLWQNEHGGGRVEVDRRRDP